MDYDYRTVGSCYMANCTLACDVNDQGDNSIYSLLGTDGSYNVVDIYGLHHEFHCLHLLYHSWYILGNEHYRIYNAYRPIAYREHAIHGSYRTNYRIGCQYLHALRNATLDC